ncbi:hypothetical protein C9374_002883 [Naegleria lovaniensis]|uniref:Citrate synthase n=1 Tax=Naegleria lovaniensis TaxID=51637 RepID=A0AA88KLD7_NAELO|nr:uncharacterized protein C9374_002883 [Naegleria lovaniensis]KAG2385734.1 hypothetical protein C9374_002883 [Naegleria lovaniensis]
MSQQASCSSPMQISNNQHDQDQKQSSNNSSKNTLTVTDNRTGKSFEIPVEDGYFINSTHFKKMVVDGEDKTGIMCFDPSFMNTAVADSKICYIDGEKGELRYRGYRIEELAEKSTFLEVAYLLIYGELPTQSQYKDWSKQITTHTFIHENLVSMLKTFRYDAHPMGILISGLSALGTFYAEANPALVGTDVYKDENKRNKQIFRLLGKVPTIAACAYRHRIGRPYNTPVNHLSYTENFLYMLDRLSEPNYRPHPRLAKALDVLFILHADHELNCSTAAMRHVGSSLVDPYTAVSASAAALYGPLHGGANEAVLHMLEEISKPQNVPQFLQDVKNKKRKLMGFGHRVYKNYDPRAKILKGVAKEVFEICGKSELWAIAEELERQALQDEYFVSRKLFPNIDFYSGLIYQALGFPTDMFPVLFTIPRVAGWLAHWREMILDPNLKIFRPRQKYTGYDLREYVSIEKREPESPYVHSYFSQYSTRRMVTNQYWSSLRDGDEEDIFDQQQKRESSGSTEEDSRRDKMDFVE